MTDKLIILDRDGVINHDSDAYIKKPDEWQPIAGSLEAISRLHQAGYRIVVATNQSGVGRGLFDMGTLNAIHEKMHRAVAQQGGYIDAIFFCPHTDADQCLCRKPQTGMLKEIIARFNVNPEQTHMVGDTVHDLHAATAVGCIPNLVLTGKGEQTQHHPDCPNDTKIHADLMHFADTLLASV